jgi:hypothetical protein
MDSWRPVQAISATTLHLLETSKARETLSELEQLSTWRCPLFLSMFRLPCLRYVSMVPGCGLQATRK